MTCPSSRHRAGMIEIKNRMLKEKKKIESVKEEVTPEEHQRRMDILKQAGLVK